MLLLAATLAGCSTANVSGQGSRFTSTGAPPAGSSVSGGSVGIDIRGASANGVVVTVAALAALIGVWRDEPARRAVPELLEGRGINEVDCTQPIGDWSKNLRCR